MQSDGTTAMARTNVARVFLISLYALTMLTGIMTALAEAAFFPGIATLPVAMVAFFENELRGRWRLSRLWFRILVAGAFAVAGFEYLQGTLELRVLAVQHLFVYLTWIVLFVHRPPRHYWWLCGLGLLQVAFGAILTGSGWFGVLLVAYLLGGMWTLALFTLYQGELRALTSESTVKSNRSGVRNSIQFGQGGKWFSFRFAGNVFLLALAGTCLGGTLFLFVPRVWSGGAKASMRTGAETASSGFSEEVRLGSMGEILENNQRVLQVRLFNNDSNTPLDVIDYAASFGLEEPYFRGMVLDSYSADSNSRGQWKLTLPNGQFSRRLSKNVPTGLIRQEYILEGLQTNILFAMSPFATARMRTSQQFVEMHPENSALSTLRNEGPVRDYFIFSRRAGTDFRPGQRYQEFPANDTGNLQRYLVVPNELERLSDLAHELVQTASSKTEHMTTMGKANAIVDHLRDSGEYGYTLKAGVIDPKIDPVEDFLFNRREGHCEHYATALTLMLRSVGIPSRLITGFKGGRFNDMTNAFEVQQRHAHSWVEAFVDGKWVTLDATPGGRQTAIEQGDRTPNFWKNLRSLSSSYWDTYVMRLDGGLQQELLYDPIQKKIGNSMQSVRTTRRTQNVVQRWLREFYTTPQVWLGWRGVLAVGFLAGVGWLTIRIARRLPELSRRLSSLFGVKVGRRQVKVDFYERFCRMASLRGFERRPEQTQQEFVEATASAWSDPPKGSPVLQIPERLPELFYHERFGGEPVNETDRAAMAKELDALEARLQESKPRR